MQKLFLQLLFIFFAYSYNLADFQHTPTIAPHNTTTNNIFYDTMDNAWNPLRRNERGRGNQAKGSKGGKGGRLAPAATGRVPPLPGSPITTRLSVEQPIPSDTDALLDVFLQVTFNYNISQRTTMDVHHVKKSTVVLKTHGYAYPDLNGLIIPTITAFTIIVSLEQCCLCIYKPQHLKISSIIPT
jgi:hypothetical protein